MEVIYIKGLVEVRGTNEFYGRKNRVKREDWK